MRRPLVAAVILGAAAALRPGSSTPAPRARVRAASATADAVLDGIGAAWGLTPNAAEFDISLQHEAPPVLRVTDFLTAAGSMLSEC